MTTTFAALPNSGLSSGGRPPLGLPLSKRNSRLSKLPPSRSTPKSLKLQQKPPSSIEKENSSTESPPSNRVITAAKCGSPQQNKQVRGSAPKFYRGTEVSKSSDPSNTTDDELLPSMIRLRKSVQSASKAARHTREAVFTDDDDDDELPPSMFQIDKPSLSGCEPGTSGSAKPKRKIKSFLTAHEEEDGGQPGLNNHSNLLSVDLEAQKEEFRNLLQRFDTCLSFQETIEKRLAAVFSSPIYVEHNYMSFQANEWESHSRPPCLRGDPAQHTLRYEDWVASENQALPRAKPLGYKWLVHQAALSTVWNIAEVRLAPTQASP